MGREGFRLGLTKEVTNDEAAEKQNGRQEEKQREQRIINVSWLSLPVGAVLSAFALLFHLHSCRNNDTYQNNWELIDYKLAGMLYCLASFIESLAEPLVISCLQRLDVSTKAKAEGISLLFKGISCFGTLYLTSRYDKFVYATIKMFGAEAEEGASFAVTAFGVSQLVYAALFTCMMYRSAFKSVEGIRWPKLMKMKINNPYRDGVGVKGAAFSQNLDLHTLYLVLIFTLQGLFKHALTEADKIVLSALAGSYDQGVYALASSYGGLAARMLLQPFEENARLLFSRQGALIARSQDNQSEGEKKDYSYLLQDLENTYCNLIRGVLYIGFIFAAIATNYTSILLRVLAGDRWGSNSEASDALSAFCVYTSFLALNGTTEAFVYGVARSGKDVGQLGMVHAMIGGVFAVISPGLVRSKGAVGLVAANCICMGLRSVYSLYYATSYFAKAAGRTKQGFGFKVAAKVIPYPLVICMFGSSFVVTRMSLTSNYERHISEGANWLIPALKHIVVGVVCVAMIVAVSLYLEQDIRIALLRLIGRKPKTSSGKSCNGSSNSESKLLREGSLSEWYMTKMEDYELLTKTITAGLMGIVGDIFAQGLEQYLEKDDVTTISDLLSSLFFTLDKHRTFALFCDGLITGPLLHHVYELYETLLPIPEIGDDDPQSDRKSRKRLYLTIVHVLIDNTLIAILYIFLTMCTTAIFEGHYETIPNELRHDFYSAVKASWASSIVLAPMQLVSFLYLPKELKVLAVNVQDIVWVAVISYATHLNRH